MRLIITLIFFTSVIYGQKENILYKNNKIKLSNTFSFESLPKRKKVLSKSYSYDSCGNEVKWYWNEDGKKDIGKSEYTYSNNCKVTKRIDYTGSAIEKVLYFEYDTLDNCISLTTKNSKNDLISQHQYFYSNKTMTKEIRYDTKLKPDLIILYEYDEKNLCKNEVHYNFSFNDTLIANYFYDSKNRIVKEIWTNPNKEESDEYNIYEYNDLDNTTTEFFYKDNELKQKFITKYNKSRLEIEWLEIATNSNIVLEKTITKYKYYK